LRKDATSHPEHPGRISWQIDNTAGVHHSISKATLALLSVEAQEKKIVFRYYLTYPLVKD
jgi:hypothetical protein